jgi:uncharacterized protein (DUF1501 family)
MKRRELIQNLAALGLLPQLGLLDVLLSPRALANTMATRSKAKKSLVVIFQRGAVDGLSMLAPYGDSNYNKQLRPSIGLSTDKLIKLDSYFGLNPALASFKPLWDAGHLSVLQQVGSPSPSRSHFDSQDYMESGTPDVKSTDSGFLARAAQNIGAVSGLKLTSLSVQPNLPRIISGDKTALSFDNLGSFAIRGFGTPPTSGAGFEGFFDSALDEVLKGQNKNSVSLLGDFAKAKEVKLSQDFPKGQMSNHLKDIAKVIKSGIYIPFIVTEVGGWDTHVNQGNEEGSLSNRLRDFSGAIAAFTNELGPKLEDVTIITVTEFGRTVKENGNKGTDHGHGSCFFVINGNLRPKHIVANWKDLKKENLFEERDVPVTTDFRDVFSEILSTQLNVHDFKEIFPNFKPGKKLGLYS